MRANEFITEDNLDEALPKWAKGALGAAALAGAGAGYMATQPTEQPKTSASVQLEHPDLNVLAQTIWGEARQDGAKGMIAVGNVIKNRVAANKKMFGQGIRGVALKPKQFSCWNPGDPNREKLKDVLQYDKIISMRKSPTGEPFNEWFQKFKNTGEYLEYKSYLKAKEIAQQLLDGKLPDPTKGATYYHTTDVKPIWRKELDKVAQFGDHVFYTLPDKVNEYKVDNVKGLGAVPHNQDVDYFGLRVKMRPSTFLKLAYPIGDGTSVDYIMQHLDDGGALGAPFLNISIPRGWREGDLSDKAKVKGHEGRNRMLAVLKSEGDKPVEVHLFFTSEFRARHLTKDMLQKLQTALLSETGQLVMGDLFSFTAK